MAQDGIIFGQYVRFDISGTRITQALRDALVILDEECKHGPGGIWDISRNGKTLVATPVDGPFDTLYFDRKKGKWSV
jgi:hypothetical protein